MLLTLQGARAEAAAAWALLSDPDHLNRLAGSPPLRFEVAEAEDGFPALMGEMLGPIGLRHRFEEVDQRWVAGQSSRIRRVIEGPLLRGLCFETELRPDGDGVIPILRLELSPRSVFVEPLVSLGLAATGRVWQRCLDALPAPGARVPAAALRHLDHATAASFQRWRASGAPAIVVDRLRRLFECGPLWSLSELRPSLLADRWGLQRPLVLAAFIEAVGAGLLDALWCTRCPRCAHVIGTVAALSLVQETATCPCCRLSFAVDLATTVEVLWSAPTSMLPRGEPGFATWFPALRPEVRALCLLPPGGQDELRLPLAPGRWQVVCTGEQADQTILVEEGCPSDTVSWSPLPLPTTHVVGAGPVTLRLENPTRSRLRLQLIRADHQRGQVPAAKLTTSGHWRSRFGTPSLAPRARLSVSDITVLFTDLTDSTGFYLDQGDRAALQFVVAHFALLDRVVEDAGGTRVKTTGDSLLAAFFRPEDAVRAALAAHEAHERHLRMGAVVGAPRLRVGLHRGPALAMHTDTAGLDYFGSTVSIANRAVDVAIGGSALWTDTVAEVPEVAALVAACGLLPERLADIAPGLGLWQVVLRPPPG